MTAILITKKKVIGDEAREGSASYDFGDNLSEALDLFDEKAIFSHFRASAKITARTIITRALVSGKSPEEVSKCLEGWKPGIAIERKSDPTSAFRAKFAAMSREEQIKALADLKATLEQDDSEDDEVEESEE